MKIATTNNTLNIIFSCVLTSAVNTNIECLHISPI